MEIPFRELQHCNSATASAEPNSFELCRAPGLSATPTVQQTFCQQNQEKKKLSQKNEKFLCEVFVNRNACFVPLQCDSKVARPRPANRPFAKQKQQT